MKRRREFVSMVGVGTVALSGCSSDEGDTGGEVEDEGSASDSSNEETTSEESTSEESTSEESTSEESTSEEAEFELVEWELPSEIQINESTNLAVTVENVGGSADDFTAPIYERTPDTEWTKLGDADFGTVQPGEQSEMEGSDFVYRYINRFEYALGDFQETAIVQTVSAKINWGTEYTTPNGYVIRVDEPELQSSYEYEDYSGEVSLEEPENGGQWAFVNIYVSNETGQANYSPLANEFPMIYGNSQADGTTVLFNDPINRDQSFDGGELQPGVERSGWVAYEIPSDTSVNDLRVAWSQSTLEGELSVNWE
jgi:hypothetical protein